MNSLLSIDLGTNNLHIIEGVYMKNEVQVDKAMIYPIPEGCMNGESISDISLLSATLAEALKLFNPRTKETVLTLNASGAVARDIDLPNAKPKELDAMIKNELVQIYNVVETDIIQYKIIDQFSDDNGVPMKKYRAIAIDSDVIADYYSLLMSNKLKPIAFDVNFNSFDKLLSGELSINDRILNGNGTMFIDFGHSVTTAYIVSYGKPLFFRHIPSGCGEIDSMIYDETFTSAKEIRKLKEDGFNFFGEDETALKYFNIIRPFLYNLSDEIRKVIGFYSSRSSSGNGNIDQIYLFGGGSNQAGFAEYLESNLNIPVEQLKTISNIKMKDPNTKIEFLINAIGALIRL